LKSELRKNDEDMEKRIRIRINFAAYVLSIPFIIRAVFNIFQEIVDINETLGSSINNNTMLAPIVYFVYILGVDIIPMTSQLTTMLVIIDQDDVTPGEKHLLDNSDEEGKL
jgi:hypothetical protein